MGNGRALAWTALWEDIVGVQVDRSNDRRPDRKKGHEAVSDPSPCPHPLSLSLFFSYRILSLSRTTMSVPTTPVRRSRQSSALAHPPSAASPLSHLPPPAPSTRARTRSGGLASLEHNAGLSVSHELELGSEEEEEEDGGRSFKLRPLGKTLEQDETSKTFSSPGGSARLDAEERGELDRLRGMVLSRQSE